MNCINCGKMVPDGAKLCQYCGSPTQNDDSNATQNEKEESKEKATNNRKTPIFGIIALIICLVTLLFTPARMISYFSVIAIVVLSIVSLIRKEKLKGLAIASIILSALILIVAYGNNLKETKFSTCGITFTIPGDYSIREDSSDETHIIFISSFLTNYKSIIFSSTETSLSDDDFEEKSDDMDLYIRQFADEMLVTSTKEKAISSYVAGFNTRQYSYYGVMDNDFYKGNVTLSIACLINDEDNKGLMIWGMATDSKKEEFEEEFDRLLMTAEYTNADDTVLEE